MPYPVPKDHESILNELRQRYDYASKEWREIRDEGKIDIRYVSGDCWKPEDRAARVAANRPCLSLDELGQYVNQLINEVRQHKRAIKVTALGSGQSKVKEARARLRANLIRQIEYRSNAQIAYTSMFENTVQRSYGFLRVKARYEHPRSFYQELLIEPFENPDMVTPDPDDLSPVGADMKYAFVHEWWSVQEFLRRWPKASVRGRQPDHDRDAKKWWNGDRLQVAEYWTIRPEDRELIHLQTQTAQGPQMVAVFEDELTPPADDANPTVIKRWMSRFGKIADAYKNKQAKVMDRRVVDYPCVYQYMTNGIELLPPDPESPDVIAHKWLGTSIPIVGCYGKVLWVTNEGTSAKQQGQILGPEDGSGAKRKMLSLVRLARDPQMLYCYYRTAEAEQVGMATKFPYFVRRGSLTPEEGVKLAQSLHEPVAFIQVESTSDTMPPGTLPEMPVRNPFEPAIQALEVGAEGARRAIQAAMGTMPLPSQAQRQNEKSGKALERINSTSQKGSFHFIDHYEMAITRTGALLDELLPFYYDAARDVTVRDQKDEVTTVRINDPAVVDEESGEPLMLRPEDINDVTLSTGPSQDSEREAASDFVDVVVQNIPAIQQMSGPAAAAKLTALSIKLKNLGPIGDEMAAIIDPASGNDMTPEQLMAQLAEAQQLLQAMQVELAEKNQVIETDTIKTQQQAAIQQTKTEADAQITLAELQSKERIEMRKLEVELEIEMAKLGSAEAMARANIEQEQLHAHGDALMREQELGAEAAQADLDRQASRDEAVEGRAFEADQAERSRQAEAERPSNAP